MATKQCLTELDLSYNSLEDEGVRKICEALRNPSCNVQQLMWDVCGPGLHFPMAGGEVQQAGALQGGGHEHQLSGNCTWGQLVTQRLSNAICMLQKTPCPFQVMWTQWSALVHGCREQRENGSGETVIGSYIVRHVSGCWARLWNLDGARPVILPSHTGHLYIFPLSFMGGCSLNMLAFLFGYSLYDIFWSSEVDDELRALEESKPEVKIISWVVTACRATSKQHPILNLNFFMHKAN